MESRFRYVRGETWTSGPDTRGAYVTRNWTEAPPEPHAVKYEGACHGYRGVVTRVHNPKTGFFELKRSPIPSPTVSPVTRLHGTTRACMAQRIPSRNLPL